MTGIKRHANNPILTNRDVTFRVNSIFNAGAVKIGSDYLLLCRVELPTGRSSFLIARSKDGLNFSTDSNPCLTPGDHGDWPVEELGHLDGGERA